MSTPILETVTDAPVTPAAQHVAEGVDEHTPETPAEPPVEASEGLAVVTETVAQLATAVDPPGRPRRRRARPRIAAVDA